MKQKMNIKYLFYFLLLAFVWYTPIFSHSSSSIIAPLTSNEYKYDCIDAWIIIGGDTVNHSDSAVIYDYLEWVYERVQDCGTPEDDIYYCLPEISAGNTTRDDNVTSEEAISYGFREWAPSKVSMDGVLGVYIFGHGSDDSIPIAPYGWYSAQECYWDLHFFTFANGCDRILFIYEACNSGTWVDDISQEEQITICSTLPGFTTAGDPNPPHRPIFGEAFFLSMCYGNTVGEAFEDGSDNVKAFGYWGVQFPCIDDNDDGVAHTVNQYGYLPFQNDGNDALWQHFCTSCRVQEINAPEFDLVPIKKWYGYDPILVDIPISVVVESENDISAVSVRAVPSTWTPPLPAGNHAYDNWDPAEDTYWTDLTFDAASGNYTGNIELWSPTEGDYNLTYIVEDVEGYKGKVVTSQIGINSDGVPPEDTVDPTVFIKNPLNRDKISEPITIVVVGDDKESGLAELSLEINGETVKTMEIPDSLPYPVLTFDLDPNEYKRGELKITGKAKDNAGVSSFFEVFVEIDIPIKWLNVTLIAGGGAVVVAVVATIVGLKIVKKK